MQVLFADKAAFDAYATTPGTPWVYNALDLRTLTAGRPISTLDHEELCCRMMDIIRRRDFSNRALADALLQAFGIDVYKELDSLEVTISGQLSDFIKRAIELRVNPWH